MTIENGTHSTENGTLKKPRGGPPNKPSYRQAWVITSMVVAFMLINWADKAVLGLAATPMMRDLGFTPQEYGMAASAVYFLFSISAAAGGFLANRASTKWMLFAMAIIWSVTQLPILFGTSLTTVIIARIMLGAAEGPALPVAVHAVMKWFPEEKRNLPNALIASGSMLGLAIGAPAIALVIQAWGWRWAFGTMAITGFAWAVAWLFLGKEGQIANASKTTAPLDPAPVEPKVPYRTIYMSGTWLSLTFCMCAAYWTLTLFGTWLPSYLESISGFSTITVGSLISLCAFVSVFLMIASGFLSQFLMSRGILSRGARVVPTCASFLISAFAMIWFLNTTNGSWLQIVLLVFAFEFFTIGFPACIAMVSEICPVVQRGAALGLFTGIATSMGVIAPWVTGLIIESSTDPSTGYRISFTIGSILMACSAVAIALLAKPQQFRRRVGLD